MKESGNTDLDDRVKKDYGPGVMDSMKEALKRIWCYMRANKCRLGILSTQENTLVFYSIDGRLRLLTRLKYGQPHPLYSCRTLLTLLVSVSLLNLRDFVLPDPTPEPDIFGEFGMRPLNRGYEDY
ncbi:hypothetical protein TREMEDRAFT_57870 [Tremella mesenterica DSM 1558]|uniref:uncharacterized protein n=1 Tax=Tremella mesenterica (strain ATCC 24925 / CBS 8224 / DSM 1558 / NBRC 9311 / NRRL Y-6157 / RJB 2259-6 / UBC 559-6) TaxID=578456 RepID=UPI00032D5672|nr:uncharacterized protein TREMEDRAFT_57870 [Tremella mesenterica DSM 1558]EIW66119.1 hypothetical protein TREMEDRAFT_57870 [Tremella mesenterica DSM 1558]